MPFGSSGFLIYFLSYSGNYDDNNVEFSTHTSQYRYMGLINRQKLYFPLDDRIKYIGLFTIYFRDSYLS